MASALTASADWTALTLPVILLTPPQEALTIRWGWCTLHASRSVHLFPVVQFLRYLICLYVLLLSRVKSCLSLCFSLLCVTFGWTTREVHHIYETCILGYLESRKHALILIYYCRHTLYIYLVGIIYSSYPINAFLSLPVSLPVSLSPTQLDAMLIRLTLIFSCRRLWKCIHLLICAATQALWVGWLIKIGLFPPLPHFLQQDTSCVLGLLVFSCQCAWLQLLLRQYMRYFQATGSNVIRCRKDGNWTGSFHLCPHSKGQCSLPQNLHYSLQYSCKRGHGIGLYAQLFCFRMKSLFLLMWFFNYM